MLARRRGIGCAADACVVPACAAMPGRLNTVMAEGPASGNIRPTGPIWPVRKVDKQERRERQQRRDEQPATTEDEHEDDGKPHVDTYA